MKDNNMINTIYNDTSAQNVKKQNIWVENNDSSVKNSNEKPKLKLVKLGGDVGATKNMVVYECGEDIIIVDCGVGFPDSELFGVDVVVPDITYLLERKHKLRALFVTHAHEDHLGAIPYVIDELQVPIYSGQLVLGFLREKLKERFKDGVVQGVSFNLVTPETPEIVLGNFRIKSFGINHSVPGGQGYAIKTPQGTVLHIADYKIDWTPVLDKPIELGKIANYGEEGVLCLLSDCLGVTHEGYTKSERALDDTFSELFEKAHGRQVLVTTISSNISRMYQIINGAIKQGRKVIFSGRSMEQSSRVARELDYLPFPAETFVTEKQAASMMQNELVYIVAGCYGQSGSGLDRISRDEHDHIHLQEDAMVIFSADPNPPGVQEPVERLLHNLTVHGAEVIYSLIQDNLHVSGHGLKGDLMTVTSLSKAKFYIPIGGTATKMRAYTNMVVGLGIEKNRCYELLEGESVIFDNNKASRSDKVEIKPVYISGRKMNELSPVVVRDREQLSNEGVFVVMIPVTKNGTFMSDKIEIVTRGFVYVKDSQELLNKSRKFIKEKLGKIKENGKDWGSTRRKLENEINKMLYKELGREPLTIVHTIEI